MKYPVPNLLLVGQVWSQWFSNYLIIKWLKKIGPNPNSEAAGRPKEKGEALREILSLVPWGSRVAAGGERGEASATKQKKPALRLACLVDYTGKISNLLEDLKKFKDLRNILKIREV